MKIEYQAAVKTPAGFRSVYVIAKAEQISSKRCRVQEVLTIDDELPTYGMSRTGANRQRFNGVWLAENEIDKIKNISKLYRIVEESDDA